MVWGRVEPRGLKITSVPVVFTLDSKHFFCCTSSTIKVFSTATGEQVRHLSGHASAVTAVFAHPTQADRVVSSSLDGTVRVWNYVDSRLLSTVNVGHGVERMVVDPRDPHRVYVSLTHAASTETGGKAQPNDPNKNKRTTVQLELAKSHAGRQVPLFKTGPVGGLGTTRSGEFVVAASNNRLYLYNHNTKEKRSFTGRKPITALAVHPTEGFVATGDSVGAITLWYCLGAHWATTSPAPKIDKESRKYKTWDRQRMADQKVTTKVVQWHAHAVNCLSFTNDATYLLSGGQEAVLVVWQLETGAKQFLPRLGAQIVGVTPSPDSSLYAISTEDNTIKLVSALSYKQQTVVRGFLRWRFKEIQGSMLFDPVQQLMVLNRRPGTLQWYNPLTDRYVRELEVTPVTQVNDRRVAQYVVDSFCMAFDASSLVTLDSRKRYESDHEYERNLKFWSYDTGTQQYVLNTRVDDPHNERVTCLAYHPSRHLVVSTSRDGRFKLWARLDTDRAPTTPGGQPTKEHSWTCRSVGTYKGMRAKHAAFSTDGSLLAVAYGQVVTLWNPATNALLRELTSFPATSKIRRMAFVPRSGHLVASSKERLYLWDLLSCTVHWSVALDVKEIAVDPEGGRFLVSTRPSDPRAGKKAAKADYLLLFETSSPGPKLSWRLDAPAVLASFVPPSVLAKSQSRAASTILYLTDLQEVFLLEEYKSDLDLTPTPATAQASLADEATAFEELYGKLSVSDTAGGGKKKSKAAAQAAAPTTPDGAIDALFSAPSHVLPPVTTLYRAFMDLLVPKDPPPPAAAAADPTPSASAASAAAEPPLPPWLRDLPPPPPADAASVWSLDSPEMQSFTEFFANGFKRPASASNSAKPGPTAEPASGSKTPKKSPDAKRQPASSPVAAAASGGGKPAKAPKTPKADASDAPASVESAPKTPKTGASDGQAAAASAPKPPKTPRTDAAPTPTPKTPASVSPDAAAAEPASAGSKSARKERRKAPAAEEAVDAAAASSGPSPMEVDTAAPESAASAPASARKSRKSGGSGTAGNGDATTHDAAASAAPSADASAEAHGPPEPANGLAPPSARKSRRKSAAVAADEEAVETAEPTHPLPNGGASHRPQRRKHDADLSTAADETSANGGHDLRSRSKAAASADQRNPNGDASADTPAKRPRSSAAGSAATPAKQSQPRKSRARNADGPTDS